MGTVLAVLLLVSGLFAQSPPPTAAVASVNLPAYVAGGGAYNPLAGGNLWASAIFPISSSTGIYESTTTDLFPVKVSVPATGTTPARNVIIFQASVREGAHKVLVNDGRNMWLIGGDAGYSFAQATAAGSGTSGVTGAFTVTYVRQLTPTWALMVPIRARYLPNFGGWYPILEVGICWKPGGHK